MTLITLELPNYGGSHFSSDQLFWQLLLHPWVLLTPINNAGCPVYLQMGMWRQLFSQSHFSWCSIDHDKAKKIISNNMYYLQIQFFIFYFHLVYLIKSVTSKVLEILTTAMPWSGGPKHQMTWLTIIFFSLVKTGEIKKELKKNFKGYSCLIELFSGLWVFKYIFIV